MIREKDWNNAIEVARFVVKMKLPQERQLWVGDVAQDSVIRAFNKLHLYDETKGSFKSWVARIAKNVCIDFLRKPINKIYFKNDFTFISDEVEEDLEEIEYALAQLEKRMIALNERDRILLTYKYYKGFSGRQMANALNLPEKNIPVFIKRAKENLAKLMGDNHFRKVA
jgi:RNA polymerase sigma factor (sigma-70 family)